MPKLHSPLEIQLYGLAEGQRKLANMIKQLNEALKLLTEVVQEIEQRPRFDPRLLEKN